MFEKPSMVRARLCESRGPLVKYGITLAIVVVVSLTAACSAVAPRTGAGTGLPTTQAVFGSGRLVTRSIPVDKFVEVEVGSTFRVDITRSDRFEIEVTADDNVIDLIDVVKQGSTLKVNMESGSYNNSTCRARVTMPEIRRLRLSGASTVTMSGFAPQSLELSLSGASKLTGRLEAGKLGLVIREASNATLGGSADDLTVTASGASQANLGDLTVGTAMTSLSEASTGTINAKEKLDIDLRSGSSLFYVGNPVLGSVATVEGSTLRHR